MVNNKYDIVLLVEVKNGNPNGDPAMGNIPRTDPGTGLGIITDVCLKRKIRNYVEIVKAGKEGYNILIKGGKALNTKFKEAYVACDLKTDSNEKGKDEDSVSTAREYMLKNYYDVRTFGSVMSTGKNPCGIVHGPVQFGIGESVSPIEVDELTITRQARTKEEKRSESGDNEMGTKYIVPYGLYRFEGHVSPALANADGVLSEEDIELLWEAILNAFDFDYSAARGNMCVRKLYIFKHDSVYGNAPAHKLFDKILVCQKDENKAPRAFSDYEITVLDEDMPEGVELIEKL